MGRSNVLNNMLLQHRYDVTTGCHNFDVHSTLTYCVLLCICIPDTLLFVQFCIQCNSPLSLSKVNTAWCSGWNFDSRPLLYYINHNSTGNFVKTSEFQLVIQSKNMFSTKTSYFLDFSYIVRQPYFLVLWSVLSIFCSISSSIFLTNVTPDVTPVELWWISLHRSTCTCRIRSYRKSLYGWTICIPHIHTR